MKLRHFLLLSILMAVLVACAPVVDGNIDAKSSGNTEMELVAKNGHIEVWKFEDGYVDTMGVYAKHICYLAITNYSYSASPSIYCLP